MNDLAAVTESWNDFYRQNRPGVPFLRNVPDENLVELVSTQRCLPGRALDVGCGLGRNSIFLARNGWRVSALDLSPEALNTARTRADAAQVHIDFAETDLFDARWQPGGFDLIYDSGCLHHVPPLERARWLERYSELLGKDGQLALVAFAPESGAPIDSDKAPVPGSRTGWSFTEPGLHELLSGLFSIEALRRMHRRTSDAQEMGVDFLWVALARKSARATSSRSHPGK